MISKYVIFATAFLLTFSSVSIAVATDGRMLTPAQYLAQNPNLEGPIISRVALVPSCNSDVTCMEQALIGGGAQAVEMVFSTAAYNQLITTTPSSGCSPDCQGAAPLGPNYFGMAFNYAKFPGSDVFFRRGMQFLQSYAYIQVTVLNGGEGVFADNLAACLPMPYAACPVTDPVGSKYAYSLVNAGKEFEMAGHFDTTGAALPASDWLYCNQPGVAVPCAGVYGPTSEWCVGALGTGTALAPNCGAGTPFNPTLIYRSSHHRQFWGPKMVTDLNAIGVQVNAHMYGGTAATDTCFTPNQNEVAGGGQGFYSDTGVYAGYNTPVTYVPAQVALDTCDMYTFGFISTTPSIIALADIVNSQFAGSTTNTGNYQDLPTDVTPADALVPACAAGPQTGVNNVQYGANAVSYAPTVAAAEADFQTFENAVSCQLPVIMGYYETSPYVVNTNGWTGFANVQEVGAAELGGIYYTLQLANQCGTVSCTIGATNGGTLGGTFTYNLEYGMDGGFGSNPTYPSNWVWQADVYAELYDAPLAIGPAQFNQINGYTQYMTSSFADVIYTGHTGTGSSWYYFQQPCAHGAVTLAMCQGKAGPEQKPGPLQHGSGLTTAARTITNGEEITYNLKSGIYFYDGQKVTAMDLIASLDVENVAAGPNYPDNGSPATGISAGPNGLLAAHIFNGGMSVSLFYGKATAWNLGNSDPAMLPAHLLKYYNHDQFATASCTADLSMPFDASILSCGSLNSAGTATLPSNSYIHYLPNTNIGSGPFIMSCIAVTHDPPSSCYDTTDGAGALDANPYYFNLNWQATANMTIASPGTYTWSTPHIYEIYNPTASSITCGPSTPLAIASHSWGMCQLMAPWAKLTKAVSVYDQYGVLVRQLNLVKNTATGVYSVNIPETQTTIKGVPCAPLHLGVCFPLTSGQQYKIVLQTTFSFKVPGTSSTSSAAVWYQTSGFTVP